MEEFTKMGDMTFDKINKRLTELEKRVNALNVIIETYENLLKELKEGEK